MKLGAKISIRSSGTAIRSARDGSPCSAVAVGAEPRAEAPAGRCRAFRNDEVNRDG